MTEGRQPSVYVVAGPNGAGKSTFARLFLPDYADCREFVNADLIAAGLSPFNPEGQAIQAGRLMLERIEALARQKIDFGFETTLAGRSWMPLLHKLREQGYRLNMFFLWLSSAELAVSRVEERVRAGGHSVPEAVIRRRFVRGIRNFLDIYQQTVDGWLICDNSDAEPCTQDGNGLSKISGKARQAMQDAVKSAIAEHWRAGRPVYIWRDEQVMALFGDGTCVPAAEVKKLEG
jgi:predicted ABC-type ATPase